ncbi:MAG TPA: hypothetical protein VET65_04575 [Candidatus Limnocylindrales bacterium]|nr:hypothetical protein [Candidatus Limnocylindrales bacterium]
MTTGVLRTRRSTRLLILSAILAAGLLTGNGLLSTLSAGHRIGPAAAYLAGVLVMSANFGVQSLLAALIVRVTRRVRPGAGAPVRLVDLLAILAMATLGAAALTRAMAGLGLGTFLGWSRFFPATTLVIAMLLSLRVDPSTRQRWHRVIVPLFALQLLLTAAFTFL